MQAELFLLPDGPGAGGQAWLLDGLRGGDDVEPTFADPSAQTEPGPTGAGAGRPPTMPRISRRWWPFAVVAVVAVLLGSVVGATIERAVDRRDAARDLYRTQLNTTFWRIDQEEQRQLGLPQAQRS